jgi:hypothetical protein
MKTADIPSGKHNLKAKTKNLESKNGCFLVCYCDDHSDLKAMSTYGKSKSALEARDYEVPDMYVRRRGQISGDELTVPWDLKWNKFNFGRGKTDEGLSTNNCEIYTILRAEWRYLGEGWTRKPSKYDSVHGLDALFEKGGKYIILESKFVTPEKYQSFCNGASPLPKLGWKKDPNADDPDDPETELRQMSWKWVKSSFELMESNGRNDATKNLGASMQDVRRDDMQRVMNVFGARPVHPPAGEYGFRLRAHVFTDRKQEQAALLEVGWAPSWLINGKPWGLVEFWHIYQEDKTYLFAERESDGARKQVEKHK